MIFVRTEDMNMRQWQVGNSLYTTRQLAHMNPWTEDYGSWKASSR